EESIGLVGAQAERLIHLARVDKLAQELALACRALHWLEQGEELGPISCPRVLADRFAERTVAGLALTAETRGVRGEERERGVGIGPVLREMEVHAAYKMPGGMPRLQVGLDRPAERRQLRAARGIHRLPERRERAGIEIFAAGHRRGAGGPCRVLGVGIRDAESLPRGLHVRLVAEARDEQPAEIAPECDDRWKRRVDLRGAEQKQHMSGSPRERRLDPLRERGVDGLA